jgi:hypothetical protein
MRLSEAAETKIVTANTGEPSASRLVGGPGKALE